MKHIVVDASVVLKWFFQDEEATDIALSILNNFIEGNIILLSPELLYYEIINSFLIAQRRGRIDNKVIEKAINSFISLGISFFNVLPFSKDIIEMAKNFSITAYDASYIILAKEQGVDLITADMKLFNSVSKKLDFVKPLKEYRVV